MKWQEWVIVQKCRFMNVWNEINNFKYLAVIIPVLDIWLRERGLEVSLLLLALILVTILVSIWIFSIFWDKARMFHYQAEFDNQRNPLRQKQLREIRKIRELLESFK